MDWLKQLDEIKMACCKVSAGRSLSEVTSASCGSLNQPMRHSQEHWSVFLNTSSQASVCWRTVFGLVITLRRRTPPTLSLSLSLSHNCQEEKATRTGKDARQYYTAVAPTRAATKAWAYIIGVTIAVSACQPLDFSHPWPLWMADLNDVIIFFAAWKRRRCRQCAHCLKFRKRASKMPSSLFQN